MLQSMGVRRMGTELRVPGKLEFHRLLIRYSPRLSKETETSDECMCKSGYISVEVFDPPPRASLLPKMSSLIASQLDPLPG